MPLSDLKTALYKLLQIPSGDQAGYDTHALLAFNHAQKSAQLRHDFAMCQSRGYLVVTAETGSLLASAQAGFSSEAPTGATVSFKSITRAQIRYSSAWYPALFMKYEEYASRLERAERNTNVLERYESVSQGQVDADPLLPFATRNVLTWEGGRIYSLLASNVTVRLFGQTWLTAYTAFTDTDFLVEHGSSFLLWEAALHMNHMTGTWLPRSEGELPPPESLRDKAWEDLILWDSYMHQTQSDLVAG